MINEVYTYDRAVPVLCPCHEVAASVVAAVAHPARQPRQGDSVAAAVSLSLLLYLSYVCIAVLYNIIIIS